MQSLKQLTTLREKYPATTAASQNLVMQAADQKRCEALPLTAMPSIRSAADRRFSWALQETIFCAARETDATSPEVLLKFLAGMFAKVALVSPQWHDVFPNIVDAMYQSCERNSSVFSKAIEVAAKPALDAQTIAAE